MLKSSYSTQEEIPENLRGAYVQSGSKWVLDSLSDDHPVVVKREELLSENSNQKGKITRLTNEKTALEASTLPAGHVAVLQADADLIEKVKPHGTAKEVVDKLTEHKTLKEETVRRRREDSHREVAKTLGYEPEAFIRLQNLPEFEIRDNGDKGKTVIAKVKGENNTITEKPAAEFIESSPDYAPFLPALRAEKGKTKVFGSTPSRTTPENIFDKVRKDQQGRNEQTSGPELNPIFSKIPGRVVAPAGE